MTSYRVRPGGALAGTVRVSGATKNSGLKQMAAALLAPGVTTLRNMPSVVDLDVMVELLRATGVTVERPGPDTVRVDASGEIVPEAPYELVTRMRASFNILGPLVARCGRARVALPGGDSIGSRKVDMHLRGLEAMGARVEVAHGFVETEAEVLHGARVVLDFPSVGATENLMCAAVLAKGTTVIENAAREPEVTDLASFLNRMGAHVLGAGSSTVTIEGVEELSPTDNEVMADRIEAGTLLVACGIAGGEVELTGVRPEHLDPVVRQLCAMGMRISATADGLWARSDGTLRAADLRTMPHPGFPTDLMPPTVAALAVAEGRSFVAENVYDGRFLFVDELARMGADVMTEDHYVIVSGVGRLSGAPVQASDVRAGAALVLAGLVAEGETVVHEGEHIDRGYPDLAGRLRALGADVTRVP